tara:strand:+ start:181 stop:369 length:189 start_codon:yes stop_codon:yes gene_type:complete
MFHPAISMSVIVETEFALSFCTVDVPPSFALKTVLYVVAEVVEGLSKKQLEMPARKDVVTYP